MRLRTQVRSRVFCALMARRQITEPDEALNDGSLPELTAKQQDFVFGLLRGMHTVDAYRAAYDTANMGTNTIQVAACQLKSHYKIAIWLSAARKAGLGHAKVTIESHLSELERLKELAVGSGNLGAAVQAEQLRGKAAGHYVEQIRDLSEHDPLQTLHQLAVFAPELAKKLAEENGIAWTTETQH